MASVYDSTRPLIRDTYLVDQFPNTNFGTDATMKLGVIGGVPVQVHRILMYFDVSGVSGGTTFTAAYITFNVTQSASGTKAMTWNRLTRPTWSESQATWNEYQSGVTWTTSGGDTATPQVNDTLPQSTGLWQTADIKSLAQDALDNQSGALHILGRVVTESSPNINCTLSTVNEVTPSLRPVLTLTTAVGAYMSGVGRLRFFSG